MSKNLTLSTTLLATILGLAVPGLSACRTQTSMSSQMSDASITTSVKSKLIASSEVKGRDVDVNTEEGVVYLMGRVANSAEKSAAERIARNCEGVRNVVNHLSVGEARG